MGKEGEVIFIPLFMYLPSLALYALLCNLYWWKWRTKPTQTMQHFTARLLQKMLMSLHLKCDTVELLIQSFNVRVRIGEVIWLNSSSSSPQIALSLLPPTPPTSLLSQLKSSGHAGFFRNNKCCTLAVPLPISHFSWLRTFLQLSALSPLTLTHAQKTVLVGGERALIVKKEQQKQSSVSQIIT